MANRKEKQGGKRNGAGRPSEGKTARVSFSCQPELEKRLTVAAKQIGQSRSAIVVAAVESILEQSPDQLRDTVAGW